MADALINLRYLKGELEARPACEQAWLNYVEALSQEANTQDALKVLMQARLFGHRSDRLDRLEVNLEQSRSEAVHLVELFNSREFGQLEPRAISWAERYPADGFVWKLLGALYSEQALFDCAISPLKRAVELSPNDAEAHTNLANVLVELGQNDEAFDRYKKSLEISPENPDVIVKLGTICRRAGQLESAVEYFKHAIQLSPKQADIYLLLGNTCFAQKKLTEAEEHYQSAIKLDPRKPEAYNNLAGCLKAQGKFDEAEAPCRTALSIFPDYPDALNNLGAILTERRVFEEAEKSLRRALELKSDFSEAYLNLGIVLKESDRMIDAQAALSRAMKLNPNNSDVHAVLADTFDRETQLKESQESFRRALQCDPGSIRALVGLGNLLNTEGRFVEAETQFHRALSQLPEATAAWAAWAGLARTRKMTINDSHWFVAAESIATQPLKDTQESTLRFALGKAYDDICEYEKAFFHYQRANKLVKQIGPLYSPTLEVAKTDNLVRAFPRDRLAVRMSAASSSDRPLFIVGMPRSGTSLIEQILASHPEIYGAGELRFWGDAASRCDPVLPGKVLDGELIQTIAKECLINLDRHSSSALRVVDKMPGNFNILGVIHSVFPNARILHTQRNPIDNCLSIFFQNFNISHTYAKDLNDLAHRYREYHRLMAHWRDVLPPEVFLDVPYDALIEDQEGWSRKIIEFIGLDWDSRCVEFHKTERKIGTASNWQARQPIYKTSKERWRNYEKHVGPLLPLLELF